MRFPVKNVEAVPSTFLGPANRDGEAFERPCWNVVAETCDNKRFCHPFLFEVESEADLLVDGVLGRGDLDSELWWEI